MPDITGRHAKLQYQVNRLHIDLTHYEVELSNHNHAVEGEIGHLKNRFMMSRKVPKRL